MNRIVRGMIVMLVGVTAQIVVAQAGDICSGEHIANRVGEVYNAYTEHGSSDLESSLNGIASLESQLDAIYSECNEVRYQHMSRKAGHYWKICARAVTSFTCATPEPITRRKIPTLHRAKPS